MERQKWEYKLISSSLTSIDKMQDKCNQLGNEGWELVAINPGGGYVFKRPLISTINSEKLNNNASKVKDIIALYQ